MLGYDATTLQRVVVFVTTRMAKAAAIWLAGRRHGAGCRRESLLRDGGRDFDAIRAGELRRQLRQDQLLGGTVLDYFTPHDQSDPRTGLHRSGVWRFDACCPIRAVAFLHLLITAGKNGTI